MAKFVEFIAFSGGHRVFINPELVCVVTIKGNATLVSYGDGTAGHLVEGDLAEVVGKLQADHIPAFG
jgi:hypothetical protein